METSLLPQSTPVDIGTLLHPGHQLTAEIIHTSFLPLSDSAALAACNVLLFSGRVDDPVLALQIVELGQARASSSLKEVEERTTAALATRAELPTSLDWAAEATRDALRVILENNEALRDVLCTYVDLEELRRKLETFEALQPAQVKEDGKVEKPAKESDAMDLDDPWADPDDNADQAGPSSRPQVDEPIIDDPWETNSGSSHHSSSSVKGKERATSQTSDTDDEAELPFTLAELLSQSLVNSAVILAELNDLPHLQTVYERHSRELWPWRLKILDALPPWTNALDMEDLFTLLRLGDARPPKPEDGSLVGALVSWHQVSTSSDDPDASAESLSPEELSAWYIGKVERLDTYGLIDIQLAWVQHGASRGLPNLDAIGEDLSLLSRLAYDADLDPAKAGQWSLQTWRASTETEIVRAYLSGSEPRNVVKHIRRLVLPYLYVLESRAERSGHADPQLVERSLHDALLELPLNLALPVFEASKATLSASERLIKNDLTVARLALACLYGSDQKDIWGIMSSIFECLPVWDITSTERDTDSDKELTSTTLDSIASFVRPRKAGDPPPRPKDLFIFFTPLPFASLSRALDILDVHLESGEILSRWDTPVQLRFLLQSAGHHQDQIELAEKMVRRQSANGVQTDAKWTALWHDMLKLSGGDDSSLRGAFGQLGVEEMMRIYLGGLLASGKFDIAKRMVRRLETERGLDRGTLEEVVLATSQEFYDNAETGNIHRGGMKLAYDCLTVPASSPAIVTQRDFIEATSRLSSFGIPSSSGSGTITPLEIRYAKSKLDLVRRVLETSHDAFQHPELILDLADKLGYKEDATARIEVLGMLVESAVKAGDYDAGYAHCQEMVTSSKKRFKSTRAESEAKSSSDVVWKSCLLVGSQSDYFSIDNRMNLLGRAIEACPAEEIPRILEVWRKVEDGQMKLDEAAKRRRLHGIRSANPPSRPGSSMASPAIGEERVLGSRTAARAARLAMDFAAPRLRSAGISPQLPSGLGFSGRSPTLTSPALSSTDGARRSTDSDRPSIGSILDNSGLAQGAAEAERVRQQARRALVRGVGWLLGADASEIDGGER